MTQDLVIFEAFSSGNGLRLLREAVRRDAHVTFVSRDLKRYAYDLDRELVEEPPENLTLLTADTGSHEAIGVVLDTPEHRDAGVIAQADATIFAVARACEARGRRFLPLEVARRCTDKAAFRARLRAEGVPSVLWAAAASAADVDTAIDTAGLPAIVKPTSGTGSQGVRVAWTREDARRAANALLAGGDVALFEAYVAGPLISVELFRQDGRTLVLGLTDRVLSDPPYFAELGWTFPAEIDLVTRAEVVTMAGDALDAVGLSEGPAHVELVIGADGPVVIEINSRIAGRGLTTMLSELSPWDEYALVVGHALREPCPAPRSVPGGFLSECVITGPPAGIPSEAAMDAALAVPNVRHVRLGDPGSPGSTFGAWADLGEVRSWGSTFAAAQMSARAAAQVVASDRAPRSLPTRTS